MTNRNKSKKKRGMKYLDLSFDGQRAASAPSWGRTNQTCQQLTNGLRPHGGYRGLAGSRRSGTKQHPLSPYSFNRPSDYHQQLQDDIDQLLEQETFEKTSSPSWASRVSREPNHSGQSPLFIHNHLAASRIEQKFGPQKFTRSMHPGRCTPPPSCDGVTYYRPNRTHQYLTATDLKDATQSEVDVKLGRPTRTTLLRARQRCGSAPAGSYEARRELQKKAEQRSVDLKKMLNSHINIKDVFSLNIPEGESLHSFLIGARYNRAHYLDSKSLTDHGVYMPRDNPLGCFVLPRYKKESVTAPVTPLDSPASQSDSEDESVIYKAPTPKPASPPRSPAPPPGPPSTPKPESATTRQAWMDSSEKVEELPKQPQPSPERKEEGAIIEELLNLDDGLNVKGIGYGGSQGSRPKSSRPSSSRAVLYEAKPAKPGVLPSVHIHGMALNRIPKARDAIEHTVNANHPASAKSLGAATKDFEEKLKLEDISSRKSLVQQPFPEPKGKVGEEIRQEKVEVETDGMADDEPPVTDGVQAQPENEHEKNDVTNSTNQTAGNPVAVHNEPQDLSTAETVRETEDSGKEHVVTQDVEPREMTEDEDSRPVSEVRGRRSRVRFADEDNETTDKVEESDVQNKDTDGAMFFLTEEESEPPGTVNSQPPSSHQHENPTTIEAGQYDAGQSKTYGNPVETDSSKSEYINTGNPSVTESINPHKYANPGAMSSEDLAAEANLDEGRDELEDADQTAEESQSVITVNITTK